uniref:SAM-dependent MTase RsmB/NOP-type domain-containing protein n=1 Tax=Chromera velia CCMP2878 TaxID=1169474 RepID=A0A0G4HM28_9ALVE|eukprot:Cvel_29157.t1-p1 / transcript=Cvel_29157.t1 / gene=Cvel_29157 / organism=Chromera_velia_CCMP2878 / gene_product=Putative methyltransferase NSUN5, putative / transcript_product=Putative methyltransferase NSUN5, putative / location=Cvel_scaffold3941:2412-8932(+) / protein_length=1091 / sequence_SO=supercontig / SO=protein_coding / is_pseudo=false
MSFAPEYREAASALRAVTAEGRGIKDAIYGMEIPRERLGKVYALTHEVLKRWTSWLRAFGHAGIGLPLKGAEGGGGGKKKTKGKGKEEEPLQQESVSRENAEAAVVMAHDLIFGRGIRGGGALRRLLESRKEKLKEGLEREKERGGGKEDAAMRNMRGGKGQAKNPSAGGQEREKLESSSSSSVSGDAFASLPIYLRVNRLVSVEDAVKMKGKKGGGDTAAGDAERESEEEGEKGRPLKPPPGAPNSRRPPRADTVSLSQLRDLLQKEIRSPVSIDPLVPSLLVVDTAAANATMSRQQAKGGGPKSKKQKRGKDEGQNGRGEEEEEQQRQKEKESVRAAVMKSPLVTSGALIVQDRASCLPALALDVQEGDTVLDCCAAPGNKTLHALEVLKLKGGGRLVAVERDLSRATTLVQRLRTLGGLSGPFSLCSSDAPASSSSSGGGAGGGKAKGKGGGKSGSVGGGGPKSENVFRFKEEELSHKTIRSFSENQAPLFLFALQDETTAGRGQEGGRGKGGTEGKTAAEGEGAETSEDEETEGDPRHQSSKTEKKKKKKERPSAPTPSKSGGGRLCVKLDSEGQPVFPGNLCVEVRVADFLSIRPHSPSTCADPLGTLSGVTRVILDPSCSGSGMPTHTLSVSVSVAGGGRMGQGGGKKRERGASGEGKGQTDSADSRIGALSAFQKRALRHVLESFDRCTTVCYSTCSLHSQENEEVLESVLDRLSGKGEEDGGEGGGEGGSSSSVKRQKKKEETEKEKQGQKESSKNGLWKAVRPLPYWPSAPSSSPSPLAPLCIRCSPVHTKCRGFFLGKLQRCLQPQQGLSITGSAGASASLFGGPSASSASSFAPAPVTAGGGGGIFSSSIFPSGASSGASGVLSSGGGGCGSWILQRAHEGEREAEMEASEEMGEDKGEQGGASSSSSSSGFLSSLRKEAGQGGGANGATQRKVPSVTTQGRRSGEGEMGKSGDSKKRKREVESKREIKGERNAEGEGEEEEGVDESDEEDNVKRGPQVEKRGGSPFLSGPTMSPKNYAESSHLKGASGVRKGGEEGEGNEEDERDFEFPDWDQDQLKQLGESGWKIPFLIPSHLNQFES